MDESRDLSKISIANILPFRFFSATGHRDSEALCRIFTLGREPFLVFSGLLHFRLSLDWVDPEYDGTAIDTEDRHRAPTDEEWLRYRYPVAAERQHENFRVINFYGGGQETTIVCKDCALEFLSEAEKLPDPHFEYAHSSFPASAFALNSATPQGPDPLAGPRVDLSRLVISTLLEICFFDETRNVASCLRYRVLTPEGEASVTFCDLLHFDLSLPPDDAPRDGEVRTVIDEHRALTDSEWLLIHGAVPKPPYGAEIFRIVRFEGAQVAFVVCKGCFVEYASNAGSPRRE